jgi:cobalamin biosynthesis protein CobD/CbiB
MKVKILIISLLITSLFCYLEWGNNQSAFLFQAEGEIIYKLISSPYSIIHPFILIPLAGQLILVSALLQKEPNKNLIYTGIISLTLLIGFVFIIGVGVLNFKIIFSIIPYIISVFLTIRQIKKINYK